MKRLFVGIPLSFDLKQKLIPLLEQLSLPGVSPVSIENLHLTLKFLGEVEEKKILELEQELQKIALKTTPFRVELGHLGAFPDEVNPGVIWVRVESEEMIRLMQIIDMGLDHIRANEHKEEIPHLTLARIKNDTHIDKIKEILSTFKENPGVWDIDKFYLYEAKLTPKGPIYSPLSEFKLKMS